MTRKEFIDKFTCDLAIEYAKQYMIVLGKKDIITPQQISDVCNYANCVHSELSRQIDKIEFLDHD